MMRQTDERKLLVRFLQIMPRILFGDPDEAARPTKYSFLSIDWDAAPMASVRMGFNDFVEMTQDISGKDLQKIDNILGQNGAYTLTQARDKAYCRVMQLMTFSKIKKDVDAYLIKGIVDSRDSRFSQDQLAKMEELLSTFQEA
jgi:hypothetical protein